MAAYKATPKLPWDITEGGVIRLKGTRVTMQQLVNGRVTFDVVNCHGETVTGRVVQYPSDQKYYIQADGSLLWQVGDISQPTDTLVISASQTVQSGFTLADVHVNNLAVEFGYYLDGYTAYLAVKMDDGSVKAIESDGECFTGQKQNEGAQAYGAFPYYPTPIQSGDAIVFRDAVDKSQSPIETISSSIIAENDKWYVVVAGVRFELELIPTDTSPLRVSNQLNLPAGIYAVPNDIVFEVDNDKNVAPLYQEKWEQNNMATWWRILSGQVTTSALPYPLETTRINKIKNVLENYGGADSYTINDYGEQKQNLTIDEIVVLG